MIYQLICVIVFLLFYTLSLASVSHEKDFPFISGEKLEYDLSWGFYSCWKSNFGNLGWKSKISRTLENPFFCKDK